jgi:hypothetical protein
LCVEWAVGTAFGSQNGVGVGFCDLEMWLKRFVNVVFLLCLKVSILILVW